MIEKYKSLFGSLFCKSTEERYPRDRAICVVKVFDANISAATFNLEVFMMIRNLTKAFGGGSYYS